MDFLKHLSLSDDDKNAHGTPPPAPPPTAKEGLFNKISDVLGDLEHKNTSSASHGSAAPSKADNLFGKLNDVLQGKESQTPPPPPPAPAHSEGLLGKISGALGHESHHAPPPPPKKTDLFSKITDTISGKTDEPPKPQSLGDKINSALGGGAASEAKEGKLDKAIDLFQEHVLKAGPQNNESALEQAKDKQIADTIRKTFGIPEKHKN